jgi:hypothetical protein
MAEFLTWLHDNWSNAIGALGIIGGLYFTAVSFKHTAKSTDSQNIFSLKAEHRALWQDASQRKELRRVFLSDVDLSKPPTIEEDEFLNLVFVHYETGWQMARPDGPLTPKMLAADIRGFFRRPLVRKVWESSKQFRNPKFVEFVTRALETAGRLRLPGA